MIYIHGRGIRKDLLHNPSKNDILLMKIIIYEINFCLPHPIAWPKIAFACRLYYVLFFFNRKTNGNVNVGPPSPNISKDRYIIQIKKIELSEIWNIIIDEYERRGMNARRGTRVFRIVIGLDHNKVFLRVKDKPHR